MFGGYGYRGVKGKGKNLTKADEAKKETVDMTYGQLEVGDFYRDTVAGVLHRKIEADGVVCSVPIEPGIVAYAYQPEPSTLVKKVVRKVK